MALFSIFARPGSFLYAHFLSEIVLYIHLLTKNVFCSICINWLDAVHRCKMLNFISCVCLIHNTGSKQETGRRISDGSPSRPSSLSSPPPPPLPPPPPSFPPTPLSSSSSSFTSSSWSRSTTKDKTRKLSAG